jgi:hypothetical protein
MLKALVKGVFLNSGVDTTDHIITSVGDHHSFGAVAAGFKPG